MFPLLSLLSQTLPSPDYGLVYYAPMPVYVGLLVYFIYYLIRLPLKGPHQPDKDGNALWVWVHRGAIWLTLGGVPFTMTLNLTTNPLAILGSGAWMCVSGFSFVVLNSIAAGKWQAAMKRQERQNQRNGRPRNW